MRNFVKGLTKFILFFILICSVNILPQEVAGTDTAKESYSHAIQFYFINQVIAAYKYHITDPSALRLTLNLTGLFKEENGQYEHKGLFDTVLTDHKSENSQRFTEVKLHYLYNIKANNIIGLFLGAGPIFNYTYTVENRNRLVYIDTLTVNEYSGTSEKKWNIGITVLAGLECLIYQNISLFAEYESTFTWGKRNYDNGFTNQSYEYDLRGYEIIGLKMGLSIYF